ncbi:MAG: translation initiation factor IF-1 [Candidatus Portnoybacteria bacterium]|nr:translation initiation factor IF-1 [Candidatus Portnoybacteria bacterium]
MGQEKKGIITLRGVVLEYLPSAIYRVSLEDGRKALAHIAGRMRRNGIKVFPGNQIKIEFSEHDLTKGRIVYRY